MVLFTLQIIPYVYAQELTDISTTSLNSRHSKGSYYYAGDNHTSGSDMFSLEVIDTGINSCMQTKITPATGIEERRFYHPAYNGWSDWKIVNNYMSLYFYTNGGPLTYTITGDGIGRLKTGIIIYVQFRMSNDANATLELTSLGSRKPIYYLNNRIAAGVIRNGAVIPLIYDSSISSNGAWQIVGQL